MPRRAKRRRGARKAGARRSFRGSAIRELSVDAAVGGLKQYLTNLCAQKVDVDRRIEAVQHALQVMGAEAPRMAAPARGRPGRPAGRPGRKPGGMFRAGSLKEHIQKVLGGGGVMSVARITQGVVSSGYKSSNKTLAKSVGIALTQMRTVRKVSRGKFRLK